MWFLAKFDLEDIVDMVNNILRGLFANICKIIYPWIANLYDIFKDLGSLVYSDQFTAIYNKISLIIGIFMVFRVTFWLIESLINPDTLNDKEKNPGKIIQKVLVAVILLATTPTIFEYAFKLQNKIVSSNIIENIISTDKVPEDNSTSIGRYLAAELFINFYTPTIVTDEDGVDIPAEHACVEDFTGEGFHYNSLRKYGNLNNLDNYCLTQKADINNDKEKEFVIDFNGLFATGVGIFVCWILLMYCISLGTRYVQLIYLQVIAPIPIMCYLAPSKDNMFSKWIKQCTTTYLDLFIRIGIINFAMFLCTMLLNNKDGIILNSAIGTSTGWITLFLVLGLLTFAKKAPDLVQELLPKSMSAKASGDFGLSLKKRTEGMLGGKFAYSTLKRAPGYVAGGLGGAVVGGAVRAAGAKGVGGKFRGAVAGAVSGFATGSKKGNIIKNIGDVRKNQAAYNSKLQQWRIASGKGDDEPDTIADSMARKTESFKKSMGFETKASVNERHISQAESFVKTFKSGNEMATSKILSQRGKTPLEVTLKGEKRDVAKLIADKEQAQQTYNNFDQNREQLESSKRQMMLEQKKQELEKNTQNIDVSSMSTEDKEKKLMEIYMKNGSDPVEAKEKAHNAMKSNDEDIKNGIMQTLEQQAIHERELSINKALKEYAALELENDVQTEMNRAKQEAYVAMIAAEKEYSDYEDIGNFAFMVEQLVGTDKNGNPNKYQEHYKNILDEYNDLANSSANIELGLGLTPIDEKELIEAYNNPEKLEELSDRYHRIKGVSDKITTFKRSKPYNEDSANDKFNGGK